MFVYRNGRFHLGSCSFAIPENCCVGTSLPLDSDHGLVICPLDHRFQIRIDFDIQGAEPFCGIQEQMQDWPERTEIGEEILPTCRGWSVLYDLGGQCYKQISIPMTQGAMDEDEYYLNELVLLVIADNPDELAGAEKHRVFRELITSITV